MNFVLKTTFILLAVSQLSLEARPSFQEGTDTLRLNTTLGRASSMGETETHELYELDFISTHTKKRPRAEPSDLEPAIQKTVEKVKKTPWCADRNCTNYAAQFHLLLEKQENVPVRTLRVKCEAPLPNHRLNAVLVKGLWCPIEPQNGKVYEKACRRKERDLLSLPNDLACEMSLQEGEGCQCKINLVSKTAVPPAHKDFECKLTNSKKSDCEACCEDMAEYYRENEDVKSSWKSWNSRCLNNCQALPEKKSNGFFGLF